MPDFSPLNPVPFLCFLSFSSSSNSHRKTLSTVAGVLFSESVAHCGQFRWMRDETVLQNFNIFRSALNFSFSFFLYFSLSFKKSFQRTFPKRQRSFASPLFSTKSGVRNEREKDEKREENGKEKEKREIGCKWHVQRANENERTKKGCNGHANGRTTKDGGGRGRGDCGGGGNGRRVSEEVGELSFSFRLIAVTL